MTVKINDLVIVRIHTGVFVETEIDDSCKLLMQICLKKKLNSHCSHFSSRILNLNG